MKNFGLENKNIIVTGGDGFLGTHIRNALKEEGTNIISFDVKDSNTSRALDITDECAVKRIVDEIKDQAIDGLVCNAAISYKGNNITQEQFNKTLQTNITGTYNCITGFKNILSENAGIVNVSSIYGMLSPDFRIYNGNEELYNSSAYGASKAAIIQMTKYYAVQFAPLKINTVSPGGIFQGHKDSFSEKYSERVPMKRMAEPEEIVNAILFLLSPLSNYITGQNIAVDGGLSAW